MIKKGKIKIMVASTVYQNRDLLFADLRYFEHVWLPRY